jgi:hypothetical protein
VPPVLGSARSPRQDQLNDGNAQRADFDAIGNMEASQPDAPRRSLRSMRTVVAGDDLIHPPEVVPTPERPWDALETDWLAGAAGFEPLHIESEFAKTLSSGAELELAHLELKVLERTSYKAAARSTPPVQAG